jgi:hypothetical protein
MAVVNDNDILRVTAKMHGIESGAVENVYTFRWNGIFPAADADVMLHVATYVDTVYSAAAAVIDGNTAFDTIECFNVTQDRPMPIAAWPTMTAGTGAGANSPEGNAAFLFFRTGQPRVIARKWIGLLPVGALTNGVINVTPLGTLVSAFSLLLGPDASLDDNGVLTYGVVDKGGVFRQVVDITGDSSVAYQRRRRRGRGA